MVWGWIYYVHAEPWPLPLPRRPFPRPLPLSLAADAGVSADGGAMPMARRWYRSLDEWYCPWLSYCQRLFDPMPGCSVHDGPPAFSRRLCAGVSFTLRWWPAWGASRRWPGAWWLMPSLTPPPVCGWGGSRCCCGGSVWWVVTIVLLPPLPLCGWGGSRCGWGGSLWRVVTVLTALLPVVPPDPLPTLEPPLLDWLLSNSLPEFDCRDWFG